MSRRRLPTIVFLGINVAVSIITTLFVLLLWDSRRQPQTLVLPTFSGVSAQDAQSQSGESIADASGDSSQADSSGETSNTGEAGDTGAQSDGESAPANTSEFEQVIHVVQTGDLLVNIALQYDVPVEDILVANGLDDPDVLDVGQELIIPVGGLPITPTPSPTLPQPTATIELVPIATVTPLPPGTILILVEQVLSPGDVTSEAVVISNQGSALDMEGWVLSDEAANEFVFPSFRLFGNGASVTVHTGVGEATPTDLYWGLSIPVWGEASDTVILRDPTGNVQSEFPIEQ